MPYPILEPEEEYELFGGVYNNEIYIYYGATDKYIALAKYGLDELLVELCRYPLNKA